MATIGMNLAGVSYYSSEFPFLDRFKSSQWYEVTASGWQPLPSDAPLDANGYPTRMADGVQSYSAEFSVDPPGAGTDNTYVVTYGGTATVTIPFDQVVSATPGRIVFRHDGTGSWTTLQVSGVDPAHPISDIHIVRLDQEPLYAGGALFNPAFTAKAAQWGTLRYMDWGNTNGNQLVDWSQRTTPGSASWAGVTATAGVPIEVEVRLANETHTNMWINIPAHASDDYVRQTLAYVHDHLDPTLKVDLEYSNEVWNFSFEQAHYALTMGDQLWGKDANHDGRIDPNDPAEHVGDGWVQYYGYRSAQVAAIAQAVFGADAATRLNDILSTQTAYLGLEQSILTGVAKAKVGTAAHLFDTYAVTTYFGGELDGIGSDAASVADRATVLGWARGGSAGMDAAFHELEFGGSLENGGSLTDLAATLAYQMAVATRKHLSLVAYEGGAHLTAVGYDAAVRDEVAAFFTRLDADPRMGVLYTRMTAEFAAAGGGELNVYNDAGSPSVYGDWGVLGSTYDSGSARYDALVAATHATDLTSVATALSSYVMDLTTNQLSYTGKGNFTATGNLFADTIVGGAHDDMLYGMAGDDHLSGGRGDDVLDGGMGADRMAGGPGNDIYYVDDAGDVVTEAAGAGTDEVRTSLSSYVLPTNVEALTHLTDAAFTGTGNALDNPITGSATAANVLHGLDGNDTLIGGTGNDLLDGGIGADRMVGGAGDDIYLVDDRGDTIVEAPGAGTDEVRTALASYALGDNLENLTFTGSGSFAGTGNMLANVITGGSGNDLLDGGAGADHLIGGAGDDTYLVDDPGDVVVELPGGGNDTVRTALADYMMTPDVEMLVYTGNPSGAFHAVGNASDNLITGSAAGSNTLFGGDGDDVLAGGSGNDQLDGGAGADRMTGGAGNDTYSVDNVGDTIVEGVNGGTDTVYSSVSYALPANVETLLLTGTAGVDGTGNALANAIFGNDGANHLSGGGGDDTIVASGGDDVVAGGDGNDTLLGQDGNDRLSGGAGQDLLSGGDGNDVLNGGAGQDTLHGDAGADRFTFKLADFAIGPDATTGFLAWADHIADFSHAEHDRIDLSAIDANIKTAVDDAFTFIGTNPFTDHPGELRIDWFNGYADVMGDIDGDGRPDFQLNVTTATMLVAGDFVL